MSFDEEKENLSIIQPDYSHLKLPKLERVSIAEILTAEKAEHDLASDTLVQQKSYHPTPILVVDEEQTTEDAQEKKAEEKKAEEEKKEEAQNEENPPQDSSQAANEQQGTQTAPAEEFKQLPTDIQQAEKAQLGEEEEEVAQTTEEEGGTLLALTSQWLSYISIDGHSVFLSTTPFGNTGLVDSTPRNLGIPGIPPIEFKLYIPPPVFTPTEVIEECCVHKVEYVFTGNVIHLGKECCNYGGYGGGYDYRGGEGWSGNYNFGEWSGKNSYGGGYNGCNSGCGESGWCGNSYGNGGYSCNGCSDTCIVQPNFDLVFTDCITCGGDPVLLLTIYNVFECCGEKGGYGYNSYNTNIVQENGCGCSKGYEYIDADGDGCYNDIVYTIKVPSALGIDCDCPIVRIETDQIEIRSIWDLIESDTYLIDCEGNCYEIGTQFRDRFTSYSDSSSSSYSSDECCTPFVLQPCCCEEEVKIDFVNLPGCSSGCSNECGIQGIVGIESYYNNGSCCEVPYDNVEFNFNFTFISCERNDCDYSNGSTLFSSYGWEGKSQDTPTTYLEISNNKDYCDTTIIQLPEGLNCACPITEFVLDYQDLYDYFCGQICYLTTEDLLDYLSCNNGFFKDCEGNYYEINKEVICPEKEHGENGSGTFRVNGFNGYGQCCETVYSLVQQKPGCDFCIQDLCIEFTKDANYRFQEWQSCDKPNCFDPFDFFVQNQEFTYINNNGANFIEWTAPDFCTLESIGNGCYTYDTKTIRINIPDDFCKGDSINCYNPIEKLIIDSELIWDKYLCREYEKGYDFCLTDLFEGKNFFEDSCGNLYQLYRDSCSGEYYINPASCYEEVNINFLNAICGEANNDPGAQIQCLEFNFTFNSYFDGCEQVTQLQLALTDNSCSGYCDYEEFNGYGYGQTSYATIDLSDLNIDCLNPITDVFIDWSKLSEYIYESGICNYSSGDSCFTAEDFLYLFENGPLDDWITFQDANGTLYDLDENCGFTLEECDYEESCKNEISVQFTQDCSCNCDTGKVQSLNNDCFNFNAFYFTQELSNFEYLQCGNNKWIDFTYFYNNGEFCDKGCFDNSSFPIYENTIHISIPNFAYYDEYDHEVKEIPELSPNCDNPVLTLEINPKNEVYGNTFNDFFCENFRNCRDCDYKNGNEYNYAYVNGNGCSEDCYNYGCNVYAYDCDWGNNYLQYLAINDAVFYDWRYDNYGNWVKGLCYELTSCCEEEIPALAVTFGESNSYGCEGECSDCQFSLAPGFEATFLSAYYVGESQPTMEANFALVHCDEGCGSCFMVILGNDDEVDNPFFNGWNYYFQQGNILQLPTEFDCNDCIINTSSGVQFTYDGIPDAQSISGFSFEALCGDDLMLFEYNYNQNGWFVTNYGDQFVVPVVLDLNGDGIDLVNAKDSSVTFDIHNNGTSNQIGWVGANDGILVYDFDAQSGKDIQVDQFSFTHFAPGTKTDLEAIRVAFDSNHDNVLNNMDTNWNKFGVWQDANQDGLTDQGEYHSLADLGITALNLLGEGETHWSSGNIVHGLSSFERADGTTGQVGDVALRFADVIESDTDVTNSLPNTAANDSTTTTLNTATTAPLMSDPVTETAIQETQQQINNCGCGG